MQLHAADIHSRAQTFTSTRPSVLCALSLIHSLAERKQQQPRSSLLSLSRVSLHRRHRVGSSTAVAPRRPPARLPAQNSAQVHHGSSVGVPLSARQFLVPPLGPQLVRAPSSSSRPAARAPPPPSVDRPTPAVPRPSRPCHEVARDLVSVMRPSPSSFSRRRAPPPAMLPPPHVASSTPNGLLVALWCLWFPPPAKPLPRSPPASSQILAAAALCPPPPASILTGSTWVQAPPPSQGLDRSE
ncbi:pollen-specific leucine-rich repeat extensin-like protein 3 [Phragmites australis]|uniref:pollen-specific leucine-rich repeat extensin-like protein 3 n=1 Tax=Phragmites australis TaxID=29695 RepID=UPI002D777CC9|nr:pollen-specific leucine-rich repeat extensin-like protein 3 [Phragmites australis]